MHGVVVNVRIESGRVEEAQSQLESRVLPRVRETPGVVAGYWLAPSDGEHGMSLVVFESEEAARAAGAALRNAPLPDAVTIESVEVREVVAHL